MSDATRQTYRYRILKVQLFIQEHLDEDLGLDRLARVACFSSFHFHRVFKGIVGESVSEYVRRLRLELAVHLLKSSDRSVTAIALECGYAAHEAFTRAFRQAFGVAPSAYRAAHRAGETLPSMTRELLMEPLTTEPAVEIVSLPEQRVAFLRHVGPYEDCGPTFDRFCQLAGAAGLLGPTTTILGISHDDPDVTPSDKIRFDCGCIVDASFEPASDGELSVQTLAGGDYAKATHRGPYTQLHPVYHWLFGTWLPTSGREVRNAPPFEVYRNSPTTTPPSELITDIHIPLAP